MSDEPERQPVGKWADHAACACESGRRAHMAVIEDDHNRYNRRERTPTLVHLERIAIAKLFCADCPVVAQCTQHQKENHEHFGIWGGIAAHERQQVADETQRPARNG